MKGRKRKASTATKILLEREEGKFVTKGGGDCGEKEEIT